MPVPNLDRISYDQAIGLMKIRYLNMVRDTLWNSDDQLYARFEKIGRDRQGVSAAGARIPVNLGGVLGGQFVPEGGDLPTSGGAEWRQFEVFFHDFVIPLRFTERQWLTLQGNDVRSVANVLREGFRLMTLGARKIFSRLIPGDGSGRLATVSAATTNSSTVPTGSGDKAFFIDRGMVVDIYDSTGTTKRNSAPLLVTAVAADLSSFTVNATLSLSANDVVYLAGSKDDAFHGLSYHINNSGTYQGISRADYPHQLNSIVVDKAGNAVSLSDFRRVFGRVRLRGVSNKRSFEIWASVDQLEPFLEFGTPLKRFTGTDLEPSFNEEELTIEGVKIFAGIDLPAGTWWFLNMDHFFWLINKDLGPKVAPDGKEKYYLIPSGSTYKNEYITWYSASLELVGTNPRCQALIKNASFQGAYRAGV
ncbi:MAG: hypothetical protein QXI60_09360 [Thermofilaceae archaeon]